MTSTAPLIRRRFSSKEMPPNKVDLEYRFYREGLWMETGFICVAGDLNPTEFTTEAIKFFAGDWAAAKLDYGHCRVVPPSADRTLIELFDLSRQRPLEDFATIAAVGQDAVVCFYLYERRWF